MIRQTFVALTLLASALAAPANAELATWFEVEVAVFERPQSSSETWPEDKAPVKTSHTFDLLGPAMMPDLTSLTGALSECDPYSWQNQEPCPEPAAPQKPQLPSQLPNVVTSNLPGDPLLGKPFLLDDSELEFTAALNKLKRQGMKLKLHSVWKQPVYSRGNSQAYRLYSGNNFGERFFADGRLRPAQDSAFSQFDFSWPLVPYSAQTDPVWELDGWLRIYLNHFLYIDTKLQLREEIERPITRQLTAEEAEQSSLNSAVNNTLELATEQEQQVETEPFLSIIEMKQSRRVRSREVHYFDHPRLGMVVQIRRMPQPKAETEE